MEKNDTEKVSTTSADIENDNLKKLRVVFPQFVKDGFIDFDALQAFFMKEGILAGTEKYGLSWAGKSKAFGDISRPATGTLTPQLDESRNWDTTENIFIEGENLEVLKLLQKHYANPGKIKMIYIDPPYNTGKDRIYADNFNKGISDYYDQTGQSKDGIKLISNSESNGRYHSDWLTMMYPRLFLARNLLNDDGVIFISIDDNEVTNLRMIMDEIFGEENFIATIHWRKVEGKPGQAGQIGKVVEYILIYSKLINNLILNKLPLSEKAKREYRYEDEKGVFRRGQIYYPGRGSYTFSVQTPFGTILEGDFTVDNEEFGELNKNNEIYWAEKGDHTPYLKVYLKDTLERSATNDWTEESGSNQGAVKELKKLFEGKEFFDNPKPIKLIKKILNFSTKNNTGDIILDFFAGSGTTAHAVMDLNTEDNGNRKWICAQLPETIKEDSEAYRAGYKTISALSRERIRRASVKIDEGDIGFKAFSLSVSNYRKWNTLTEEDDAKTLIKQAKLFLEKPLVDSYDEESVVYEILEKEGFDLNSFVQVPKKDQKDLPLWVVVDKGERSRKMTITFAKKVTKEAIAKTGIGETDNETFVCFDSALDDTTKVNIARNLKIKTI